MNEMPIALQEPIDKLRVSAEFCQMCTLNNFKNLGDIVKYKTPVILRMPGMSMRVFMELLKIVEKNNLAKYLKDE